MKRRHPIVHLPQLNPDDALHFADLLERIIEALWQAHGYDMAMRGIERSDNAHPGADHRLPRPRMHLIDNDDT